MRGNIIEELYYGNIDPQDRGYCPKSPVKKVSDSLNDLEEKLTEQLTGENKALFLRFCNAYAEFMGECELDTFITGFRLGARFMMDSFIRSSRVNKANFSNQVGWKPILSKSYAPFYASNLNRNALQEYFVAVDCPMVLLLPRPM